MTRVDRIVGDFQASSSADCLPADWKKLMRGLGKPQ